MSLLAFLANPLGGGKLTLRSQNSAIDRTLDFPDSDGVLVGYKPFRLWMTDSPGKGAVDTGVVRFTTTQELVGTSITVADNASNGTRFTVVDPGDYMVEFATSASGGAVNFGVTVNAAGGDLTAANFATVAWPVRRALAQATGANLPFRISTILRLLAGDVVRCQVSSAAAIVSSVTEMRISRVG